MPSRLDHREARRAGRLPPVSRLAQYKYREHSRVSGCGALVFGNISADSPEIDGELGRAGGGQVGEYAADQARELEAMSAARAGDDHVCSARQEVDEELFVGRDGVEADLGLDDDAPPRARDVTSQEAANRLDVLGARWSDRRRRDRIQGRACRATFTPRPRNSGMP